MSDVRISSMDLRKPGGFISSIQFNNGESVEIKKTILMYLSGQTM